MSAALSSHNETHAIAWSTRRAPGQNKATPTTRRRKQLKAMVRVPMLDWPEDLFGDNANTAELMAEWDVADTELAGTYFMVAA